MTVYVAHENDARGVRALEYLKGLGAETRLLTEAMAKAPGICIDNFKERATVLFESAGNYPGKHLRIVQDRDLTARNIVVPAWAANATTRIALRNVNRLNEEVNFKAALRELHARLTDWKPVKRRRCRTRERRNRDFWL